MFSYASSIYVSHPKHLSTWAAPASRTPGLLSSSSIVLPYFGAGTPSPRTSAAIQAGKVVLEGGRKVYVVLTIVWCQIQSYT
jgi:hypothetical protein